jgi:hypothetical protein
VSIWNHSRIIIRWNMHRTRGYCTIYAMQWYSRLPNSWVRAWGRAFGLRSPRIGYRTALPDAPKYFSHFLFSSSPSQTTSSANSVPKQSSKSSPEQPHWILSPYSHSILPLLILFTPFYHIPSITHISPYKNTPSCVLTERRIPQRQLVTTDLILDGTS